MKDSEFTPEEQVRRRKQFLGETIKALQSAYWTGESSLQGYHLAELQRMINWCVAEIERNPDPRPDPKS